MIFASGYISNGVCRRNDRLVPSLLFCPFSLLTCAIDDDQYRKIVNEKVMETNRLIGTMSQAMVRDANRYLVGVGLLLAVVFVSQHSTTSI